MNISDKLENLIRQVKVSGLTPHCIVMNRKHMKKLQKELDTDHEILTYKGIRIDVMLPCYEDVVKDIYIVDKEAWDTLIIEVFKHIHPNCRCQIEPSG